jgi:hypothetical protein
MAKLGVAAQRTRAARLRIIGVGPNANDFKGSCMKKFGISGANLSNCRTVAPPPKWGTVHRMPVNKGDR